MALYDQFNAAGLNNGVGPPNPQQASGAPNYQIGSWGHQPPPNLAGGIQQWARGNPFLAQRMGMMQPPGAQGVGQMLPPQGGGGGMQLPPGPPQPTGMMPPGPPQPGGVVPPVLPPPSGPPPGVPPVQPGGLNSAATQQNPWAMDAARPLGPGMAGASSSMAGGLRPFLGG